MRSLVVALLAVVVLAVPAVVLTDGRVALVVGQQHLHPHRGFGPHRVVGEFVPVQVELASR